MTLDKIFKKLQVNLFAPYLFYIPSSIIPEDKRDIIMTATLKAILDQIKYVDKKGKKYNVLTTESLYPILGKKAILDKSMFLLLEQKRKLPTMEFNFLIEKYYDSLSFFVSVSEWMHKNLHCLKTELSQEVAFYFETQNQAFQNHEKEFIKYFPLYNSTTPKTEPMDWSSFDKNEFPPLEQLGFKEIGKELTSILKTEKKPGVKKRNKLPIITDEQSKQYLLETVFNIKF